MIKGSSAILLMRFSEYVGFVLAKGSYKVLRNTDVVPLLDNTIEILNEAQEEPSFNKERDTILSELELAKKFKSQILSQRIINGTTKGKVLSKAQDWYNFIEKLFGVCLFSTLSEDSVLKLFPEELTNQIGDKSSNDIRDAVWCLVYSLPTPAAMLLFRTAEGELRKYVKKVAGKPCDKWNDNLKKLEESAKANRSIKKDFDWLKDKRNEVEHPDKRYTQDEAEEILHRLSGLLKSIYNEGKDD